MPYLLNNFLIGTYFYLQTTLNNKTETELQIIKLYNCQVRIRFRLGARVSLQFYYIYKNELSCTIHISESAICNPKKYFSLSPIFTIALSIKYSDGKLGF